MENSDAQPAFASALSVRSDLLEAVGECCNRIREKLCGPADLVFLFFSLDGNEQAKSMAACCADTLGTDRIAGCTAEGIAGVGQEVEDQPAAVVWAARLPEVKIQLMHLSFEHTGDGATFLGWTDESIEPWPETTSLLVLGDPFSFPADYLAEHLNDTHPGVPVIGGMASGARLPGEHALIVGREVYHQGAAVVMLQYQPLCPVVSQGCRPIGKPFIVTRAEQNVIYELGGRPALEQLDSVFSELSASDQQLAREGLHVGRVISEYLEQFTPGDFLIRNVLGIDPQKGAIAVGDYFRVGQTVQFHIRDHRTADTDLRQVLQQVGGKLTSPPRAALLFTCNGRGTRMFPEQDHDVATVKEAFGEIPLAGFFAQGELGPVGDKNFVHGFTASLALFG